MRRNGLPETLTLAGSDAQDAAITSDNEAHGPALLLRPGQYLHHIVEQAQRGGPRVTRPMVGCKLFAAAQETLVGIALIPMSKNTQMVRAAGAEGLTAAELCYSLAASSLHRQGQLFLHDHLSKICDRAFLGTHLRLSMPFREMLLTRHSVVPG